MLAISGSDKGDFMKKSLVTVLVVSLIVVGLIGVNAILGGSFGGTQIKILFSTLAFTVYSVLGLSCNTILSTRYDAFARLGLLVIAAGLAYAIITTWATPESPAFLKARFSFLVVAIGFAHASLMLLIEQKNAAIKGAVVIALTANLIVAIVLVDLISNISAAEFSTFRLLGVVSVVGVIATLIAPLLAKAVPND